LGQFSRHERQCLNDLQTDQRMVTNALKQLYMPEDNPSFNEFMECTWIRDGFIDEDGNIVYERFKNYVKGIHIEAVGIPEIAEIFADDTVSFCHTIQGNTAGQTGVKLMNCILRRLYE